MCHFKREVFGGIHFFQRPKRNGTYRVKMSKGGGVQEVYIIKQFIYCTTLAFIQAKMSQK